jgi:putative oxidoreductase
MNHILGRYSEQVYAIMRIVIGLLFFCHGAMKLFGWFNPGQVAVLFSLMGLAGVIECFGGLLIAIGLLSSYAAFLASGMMAVAYFKAHSPRGFWPINNGGELAVLYCFVFLFIAAKGSGKWSLDAALNRSR